MKYKTALLWSLSFNIICLIVFVVQFAIATEAFGADAITIGGPLHEEVNQLPTMLATEKDQLQHENVMAMTQTAMKVGEICVLIEVTKHAKKSKTPITLRELSKKSDACVKEQMSLLENRK